MRSKTAKGCAQTARPATPERLLRLPLVKDLTGCGKTFIYKSVNEKTFPAPVKISPTLVAWRESEVQAWIQSRTTAAQ